MLATRTFGGPSIGSAVEAVDWYHNINISRDDIDTWTSNFALSQDARYCFRTLGLFKDPWNALLTIGACQTCDVEGTERPLEDPPYWLSWTRICRCGVVELEENKDIVSLSEIVSTEDLSGVRSIHTFVLVATSNLVSIKDFTRKFESLAPNAEGLAMNTFACAFIANSGS